MRAANILAFDQHLTHDFSVGFSPDPLHDALGSFDQLAIMAVVAGVEKPGSYFKVQMFHSADGRCWMPKSGKLGDAEIGSIAGCNLPGDRQAAFFGADTGKRPSLGLVRLRVDLGSSGGAHVRVWVTGRNFGWR